MSCVLDLHSTSQVVISCMRQFKAKVVLCKSPFKRIRQYIFLLFHLEELLKLYINLFYRFCVTLLFLEIFEQKNHKSASFPPSWILVDMHVHHKQGHARILSIEQLVIMSPKSYTSVTI